MTLGKATVDVIFDKGLNSKADPKLVAQPTTLLNVKFNGGTVAQRPGLTALGELDYGGSTAGSASGLAALGTSLFKAGKTVAAQAYYGYIYSASTSRWARLDTQIAPFCTVGRTPVVQGTGLNIHRNFDWATANGVTAVVWEEYNGGTYNGLYCEAFDATNGVRLTGPIQLVAPATLVMFPRIVAVATTFHIYYYYPTGHELRLQILESANYSLWNGATAPTALFANADVYFDVVARTTDVVLCYVVTGAGSYAVASVALDGTVTQSVTTAVAVSGLSPSLSILAGTIGGVTRVWVLHTNGSKIDLHVYNSSTLAVTAGPIAVDASVGFYRATMAMGLDSNGAATIYAAWESGSTSAATTIMVARLDATSVVVAKAVLVRGCRLISEAIQMGGTGAPPAIAVMPDPFTGLQPVVLVHSLAQSHVIARALPGICPRFSSDDFLRKARPIALTAGAAFVSSEAIQMGASASSLIMTNAAITRIDVNLKELSELPRVQIGPLMFIGGGAPSYWDGQFLGEAGFHVFPESLSSPANGAGSLSSGAYEWVACYEHIDAAGVLHRSAPSPPLTVTTGASSSRTIRVPTLRVTSKYASNYGTSVTIVLYRTEVNGSLFYRASSALAPKANDKTVDYVDFVDSLDDSTLIQNELLYTQGGALEAIGAPACKYATVHGARLVIAGLEDPYEVRYSTEFIGRQAPRFNEALSFTVQAKYGAVTGLASMDGRIVVFCERGVWVVTGDGPNDLGQQNTFSEPSDAMATIGCSDWRGIVAVPGMGLAFKTVGGLRLFRRDLGVDSEWGVSQDGEYGAKTPLSALHVEAEGHLRWIFPSGSAEILNYDYIQGQWSAYHYADLSYPTDAVLWNGSWTACVGTHASYEVSSSVPSSANASSYVVETQWIRLASIQGLERIWRALLLGEANQYTKLVWEIGYDYGASYDASDTLTIDPIDGAVPFQIRRHLRRQKCQAVRFRFTWQQSAINTSQPASARFTGITLECGVASKAWRGLPSTKSYG